MFKKQKTCHLIADGLWGGDMAERMAEIDMKRSSFSSLLTWYPLLRYGNSGRELGRVRGDEEFSGFIR